MNRFNTLLSLLIGMVFILLMFFAGQPITPEADWVQRWYDTLCNPAANQSPLYTFSWRGDQSDVQFQTIVDAYRTANGYMEGCTAVENHNIIYFQTIPSELTATVERIKYVAVTLYTPDQPRDNSNDLSVRTSVHVLFYKNGAVKILPNFIPDSPLGLHQGLTPVTLYNNDGLLMGQVQRTGALIQIPQSDVVRVGIPLQLSTARAWGNTWIRIYADGIQVMPESAAGLLPADQRADFLPEFLETLAAHQVVRGVIWFSAPRLPADIRLSMDAYQTRWDMPGVPIMIKVQ